MFFVVYNSVAETKDESEGIDTQHLQTLEKLKQLQRLEHQKVQYYHGSSVHTVRIYFRFSHFLNAATLLMLFRVL